MNKLITMLSLIAAACSVEHQSKEVLFRSETVNLDQLQELKLNAIDSTYLEMLESQIDNYPTLSGGEVLNLFESYEKPITAIYHEDLVNEYLEIDSLKNIGIYDNYLLHLDIGMLRDAIAIKIGTIGEAKSLLWAIWYSSYEACPYFHGVDVYLSSFSNGKAQKTIKVGSNFSAVDPPSAIHNPIYSVLNSDGITSYFNEFEYDLDTSQTKPIYSNADTLLATL